jgi:streptomycin 6-kinase
MGSAVPRIDEGVQQRLTLRFGAAVHAWFEDLPDVLSLLAEQWQMELVSSIPRGSVSVVIRCRMSDGRPGVLKVSPDRARIAQEGAALDRWTTDHTPSVLAVDEHLGALLIEAIEPGVALVESAAYPHLESVSELLRSLHEDGVPDPSYPAVARRVTYLFDSSAKLYTYNPELAQVVSPELYARSRRLAMRLAEDASPTVLLHGDLTPSNILDGGADRGLVAIDPAPCLGDPAFDAVDLLLWQADDLDTIFARAEALARVTEDDPTRLVDWCTAFAGMAGLELCQASSTPPERVETVLMLADRAPE